MNPRRPYDHSQLLHLVSLAPSIWTSLKLHDLRVQGHDLIIQMAHLCHLQDKAGSQQQMSHKGFALRNIGGHFNIFQKLFLKHCYLCKSSRPFFVLLPGFQHLFRGFKQTHTTLLSAIKVYLCYRMKRKQLPDNTHISHSASGRCIFLGRTGCYFWRSLVWLWAAERSRTCCFCTWSGWCCSAGDSTWRRREETERRFGRKSSFITAETGTFYRLCPVYLAVRVQRWQHFEPNTDASWVNTWSSLLAFSTTENNHTTSYCRIY